MSSFRGSSKKTAWETWKVCDEVTATLCALGATPNPSIVDDSLDTLERFVVLLYDRTSNHEHVNDARKQLFTQKGRAIDALPPTREAIRQHIRRTAYHAGYCWGQMMVAAAELTSPTGRLHFNARHYANAVDSVLGIRTCRINAFPQWQFRLMLIR